MYVEDFEKFTLMYAGSTISETIALNLAAAPAPPSALGGNMAALSTADLTAYVGGTSPTRRAKPPVATVAGMRNKLRNITFNSNIPWLEIFKVLSRIS